MEKILALNSKEMMYARKNWQKKSSQWQILMAAKY
jgi:hypothetical protein